MGALHRGHVSLIDSAKSFDDTINSSIIVSIFVNPKQFNNPMDLADYPRTMSEDINLCTEQGVDCVFAPRAEDVYPLGHESIDYCMIEPPDYLASDLEGKSRPGHFKGMLTIVSKLFNITKPDIAFFGEKDYQQLLLIKKMVTDLNMGILVHPVSTFRDSDSLPLSSRNVRLTKTTRKLAVCMSELILKCKHLFEEKQNVAEMVHNEYDQSLELMLKSISETILSDIITEENRQLFELDYLELRCSRDLTPIRYDPEEKNLNCRYKCCSIENSNPVPTCLEARLLISVLVDNVRLLDNVQVNIQS